MAIHWGAWQYSGNNGMRVGIDVSTSGVTYSSNSVTFTVKYYTENQYSYSDNQTLSFGGAITGSVSFNNGSGGAVVLRATRSLTYNYGANEYGSSPGNRTFSASLSGAYNGVTPSASVTEKIPARPIGAPLIPNNTLLTLSGNDFTYTWSNRAEAGRPYNDIQVQTQTDSKLWTAPETLASSATSHTTIGVPDNRKFRYRVRARNSAGNSDWNTSGLRQTPPFPVASVSVVRRDSTTVTLSWSNNGAEGDGYDYETEIEVSTDGGATWASRATGTRTTTSLPLVVTPGQATQYRLRHKSLLGGATYSAWVNSASITVVEPPVQPTNPLLVRNTDASLTFTWSTSPTTERPIYNSVVNAWDNITGWRSEHTTLAGDPKTYNLTAAVYANRVYRMRVRVTNTQGTSSDAFSDYAQTSPAAPSAFNVSKSSPNTVAISWQHNTPAESTQYLSAIDLEQSVDGGAWTNVARFDRGTTSTSLSNLNAGGTYQFRVRAVSTRGTELYSGYVTSSTVTIVPPPAAPTGATATRVNDNSVSLSWTNNATTEAPYDSIVVQRLDSVTNSWTTIANLSGTTTSFNDGTTSDNRRYTYRVLAKNIAGTSAPAETNPVYMTPAPVVGATANYTGGTEITAQWTNNVGYTQYSVEIVPYKDGVAQTAVTVSSGTVKHTFTGIDVLATYVFKISTKSTTGLYAEAGWTNEVMGAQPPNAPVNLSPTGGAVIDLERDVHLTWTHSPSVDGSAQTAYQIAHRAAGSSTWTYPSGVTSATSEAVNAWASGTYPNGTQVEWMVRTKGVHADYGPWSPTALLTGSTTPTITRNNPPAILPTSDLYVEWDYFDAEGTPQSEYQIELIDPADGTLIESVYEVGTAQSYDFAVDAIDGNEYFLRTRVRDSSGLWSDWDELFITADFTPPAEVLLEADVDEETGAMVLSLNPTEPDGVTTLPATSVTIERQMYDPEEDTYTDWEVVVENIDPTSTIVDTTAPVHGDGHYRITTYSAAPSSVRPIRYIEPARPARHWIYLSGGEHFEKVCRMYGNIEVSEATSRRKEMHYYAGRKKPVLFTGDQVESVITIKGLIATDATPPGQWLLMGKRPGPVLLRVPGRRHYYGMISGMEVNRIYKGLHEVSFTVTEVFRQ